MSYKKFFITVDTNWVGTQETYSAIAEKEDELWESASELAFDNFIEKVGGLDAVLEELFPEAGGEYTDDQVDQAVEVESEYYFSDITEVDEEDEEQLEKFNNCELVYDSSN